MIIWIYLIDRLKPAHKIVTPACLVAQTAIIHQRRAADMNSSNTVLDHYLAS